jgi:hypothetical protein
VGKLLQIELPEPLLESIRQRANSHGRDVSEQAVLDLEAFNRQEQREAALISAIDAERAELAKKGVTADDPFLREAKEWGRK